MVAGTCVDMCVEMSVDMLVDMCIDICVDMCADLCVDKWLCRTLLRPVTRSTVPKSLCDINRLCTHSIVKNIQKMKPKPVENNAIPTMHSSKKKSLK